MRPAPVAGPPSDPLRGWRLLFTSRLPAPPGSLALAPRPRPPLLLLPPPLRGSPPSAGPGRRVRAPGGSARPGPRGRGGAGTRPGIASGGHFLRAGLELPSVPASSLLCGPLRVRLYRKKVPGSPNSSCGSSHLVGPWSRGQSVRTKKSAPRVAGPALRPLTPVFLRCTCRPLHSAHPGRAARSENSPCHLHSAYLRAGICGIRFWRHLGDCPTFSVDQQGNPQS